jgi:glycosyltransferase involved in cell wall biosynthesis
MKRQNKCFLVLATGSTADYRHPAFFDSLMQYAADCDVADCFRVLGRIPMSDLAGLIKNAVAVVNPSRFEGWSTSVEEAKSLGKQVVLSDIPVHREQAPERGIFFPPDSPDALMEALVAALNGFDEQQETLMRPVARGQFLHKQTEFATAYIGILDRARSLPVVGPAARPGSASVRQ